MNNIFVKTVPNEEIKLRHGFTGADWWWDEAGDLQVRIAAELTDWRERAALALHEVAEALMCKHNGVTVAQVDEFDEKLERDHPDDISTNAGDLPDCPYRAEHNAATAIERVLAGVLDISWQEYDDRLAAI